MIWILKTGLMFENELFFFFVVVFPSLMPYLKKLGITIFPRDIAEFFNSTMRQMIAERKQEPESTQVVKKILSHLHVMERDVAPW